MRQVPLLEIDLPAGRQTAPRVFRCERRPPQPLGRKVELAILQQFGAKGAGQRAPPAALD
jgi:hypothetical protein